MTPPFSWRAYAHYLAVGLAFMYFFKVVDKVIEATPWSQHLERSNLDALFSGRQPSVSKDIFLVTITNDDYRELFNSTSPLQPQTLSNIIEAVLDEHPRVLGVDFDTSAWKDISIPPHPGTTIVWARELLQEDNGSRLGDIPQLAAVSDCYGIPTYTPDDDGVIRRYPDWALGSTARYPTLPVNLVAAYTGKPCQGEQPLAGYKAPAELPWINFSGDARAFNRLSAGAVLKLRGTAAHPLRDKMVLLGGSYRAARDAYPTAVGYLDGVVILAHTAQTKLPGNALGTRRPDTFFHGWICVEGLVLLLVTFFVPKPWRLAVTLLSGPVEGLVGNWVWFYTGGTFISFVPYLIGLVVHQLYDHMKEHRALVKENRDLREQMRAQGLPVPESSES